MINGYIYISGSAYVGSTLVGNLSEPDGFIGRDGFFLTDFLWKADGVVLNGGTRSASIINTEEMVGKYITAHTDYTDASGSYEHPVSPAFGPINHRPQFQSSGDFYAPHVGGILTLSVTDPDGIIGVVVNQWKKFKDGVWTVLPNTSNTMTLLSSHVGYVLQLSTEFTDGLGIAQKWITTTGTVTQ